MKVQIALTVNESKRLIAKAVVSLPEIKNALEKGKILLKGGTTVSVIAEELVGIPLRICGRISKREDSYFSNCIGEIPAQYSGRERKAKEYR
jgi:hypothetical protein